MAKIYRDSPVTPTLQTHWIDHRNNRAGQAFHHTMLRARVVSLPHTGNPEQSAGLNLTAALRAAHHLCE